jgi:hypothetical protein
LPKNNLFKIGVAVAAAGVGAVLAITSVFAHTTTPTTSGHSIIGSIVKAEVAASFPFFTADAAPNALTTEQANDVEEAAELAAKIAAEQAELAAKQAAAAAEAAAEAAEAAPSACVAADQTEDTAERAADMAEDAAEKTNGNESPAEDAAEKAARQATDGSEDATEVKCEPAAAVKTFVTWSGAHHSDGGRHHGGRD